jgi:S-formylglutathione hydrolase FrmB
MAFCQLYYHSKALSIQSSAWVILPDGPGPFSVLYLLHGYSDDHTIWCRRTSLERYAEIYPSLMIVMPAGGHSFYCDAVKGPAFESAIVADLIPYIDRTFRTSAERAARAIGGLSMGGYGAIKLALQYPDLFVSAHSHSGALDFGHGWRSDFIDVTTILGKEAKGGGRNDCYKLAAECPRLPALWIDCGKDDFLLEQNRSFHAHLKKLKIAHKYQEFPGQHNWEYWDLHIREALVFHAKNLGLTPP